MVDFFARDYLFRKLGITDYKIIRYRDDYRIFTNNPQLSSEIAKELSDVLSKLNFKINSAKTLSTDDVVLGSLKPDKVHWITTLEAFDFRGVKRINDSRPHLKWMNRLFFMKHIYTTFGIDDMVSNERVTPFWGGGIRFNDDDLKYVFSLLP